MEIGKLRRAPSGARIRFGTGEMLFAALFALGAVMVWVALHAFASDPQALSSGLFFAGLFIAALSVGVLALLEPVNVWAVRIIVSVAFLIAIPIAFREGLFLAPAAALGALLMELGFWRARRVRRALRYPLMTMTAMRALPLFFSAVTMVLAAVLFISPAVEETLATQLVPEPVVARVLRLGDPFVQNITGYSLEGTVDEVIASAVARQLPQGEEVDPRVIQVQRERYAAQYGIEISGDDTVAAVLTRMLQKQASRFQERSVSLGDSLEFGYFKIGFFATAFFLFQLLAHPLSWMTMLLLFPLMALMRFFGLAVMDKQDHPVLKLRWASEPAALGDDEEDTEALSANQ